MGFAANKVNSQKKAAVERHFETTHSVPTSSLPVQPSNHNHASHTSPHPRAHLSTLPPHTFHTSYNPLLIMDQGPRWSGSESWNIPACPKRPSKSLATLLFSLFLLDSTKERSPNSGPLLVGRSCGPNIWHISLGGGGNDKMVAEFVLCTES